MNPRSFHTGFISWFARRRVSQHASAHRALVRPTCGPRALAVFRPRQTDASIAAPSRFRSTAVERADNGLLPDTKTRTLWSQEILLKLPSAGIISWQRPAGRTFPWSPSIPKPANTPVRAQARGYSGHPRSEE